MLGMLRATCALVVTVIATTLVVGTGPATAGVVHGGIVATTPSARTPQILDASTLKEKVLDLEEVGSRIVVAGIFSRVRDAAANGGQTFNRSYVFAFDAATGAVDQGFAPVLNGAVNTVLPGPDGTTVYLGGTFTIMDGVGVRNLVEVSLATGRPTAFRAPALNGGVNDLALVNGRLIVGGVFNRADNAVRGGLIALNPVTGAVDPYMGLDVTQNHNYPDRGSARSAVGVENFDVSPDGRRLVVIGNFRTVEGLHRDQAVVILLQASGAVVDPNWRTRRFEVPCAGHRFDSWVRDVRFSPDGTFFSVATTGGRYPGWLCDTVTRWETTDTGADVAPRWTTDTGGDSLYSVEITGSAVYVGGHMRWLNNPAGLDTATQGAVPRPGIAALDPRTGLPLSWNPGRHPRGVGAEALLATASGLYVGMDTEYVGNFAQRRPRLAMFPLAGGTTLPEVTKRLPANVFMAGRTAATATAGVTDVRSRYVNGAAIGPDQVVPGGGEVWSKARGGFMVGNELFYGFPNWRGQYYLTRRTFDGTAYGPRLTIDPYNDPLWSNVSTGAGQTYRGVLPTFYSHLGGVTGMFYKDGRLYYGRAGQTQLFYRYFSVDSGIVGATEFAVGGAGFNSVAGMFLSGDTIYAGRAKNGEFLKISFVDGRPVGAWTLVAPGPAAGGRDWRTLVMFLGPGGPNQQPTAAIEASCAGLTCSFDGRGSSDPDGSIVGHSWRLDDGTVLSGARVTHTFASGGERRVTLTVTDDRGATAQTAQTVPVTAPPPGAGIALREAAGTSARAVGEVSLEVPASVQAGDALVLVLSTSSDATGTAPVGWTSEGSQVSGTNITTQVWSRIASVDDAGSTVTVPLSAQAKVTLQLAAYSGVDPADPVSSVVGAADVGGTSHTTPIAQAAVGSWVLSVWSDQQSVARTWTAPSSGVAVLSNLPGVGTGDMATLLGDSGRAVPAGEVGGITADVPTPSNRATMLTIVLSPAG